MRTRDTSLIIVLVSLVALSTVSLAQGQRFDPRDLNGYWDRSGVALLMISIPALGHHGTSISYDESKKITLKGTVTEFQFRNPHIQIWFDVKDEQGNVVRWAAECGGVYYWSSFGFKRNSLKPGDQITITISPSRAGTPLGVLAKLVMPDGRVMGLNAPLENEK
jgi:hypothetical protein